MRPRTLFAATGDAIARLGWGGDGAATTSTTLSLEGAGVQCVAVDPHDPNRIFAGTFDRGVYQSDDGGAAWTEANQTLPLRRVLSVTISPYERVQGRSVVYVGIELGGVMRTRDGGKTWEDRKPGSQPDAHALATHPMAPDRVYEAAGGGVARSDDAGDTWYRFDDGMDRHYAWGLAVDAADPDLWYVSAAPGPRQAHGRDNAAAVLYRSQGGSSWQPLGTPDGAPLARPNRVMPYALLAPRDTPNGLVVGMHTGDLLISDDAGDSWQAVTTGLDQLLSLGEAATATAS